MLKKWEMANYFYNNYLLNRYFTETNNIDSANYYKQKALLHTNKKDIVYAIYVDKIEELLNENL